MLKNKTAIITGCNRGIRKSILKGAKLNTLINKIYNNKPSFFYDGQYSENDVRELLINNRLEIIPVVVKNKKIIKIIYFKDIFKNGKKHYSKFLCILYA